MRFSKLEYLWQGTQALTNLKKVDLSGSLYLKELPDLSNATNLEDLKLSFCISLAEFPSSFSHLQKLNRLWMSECIKLQVPVRLNMTSLEVVNMEECSKLRNIPVISTNFRYEDVPNIKGLTFILKLLYLSNTDIEMIPDCTEALRGIIVQIPDCTNISGSRRDASLPELPRLSLEVDFTNCVKLGKSLFFSREAILPGRGEVPAEFDHRGRGNSLTIRPNASLAIYRPI